MVPTSQPNISTTGPTQIKPLGQWISNKYARYLDRALCFIQLGQPERAIVDCNRAIEPAPHSSSAYSTRVCIREAGVRERITNRSSAEFVADIRT